MKIQLFLSSALCISNLYAMETPPRAESPHERVITTLNFDSDLANNRGIGNLQLMLTNQCEDTLETRYLSPEDYQSVRIITGCSAIDENPEKNKLYTRFFLEKFPEITVELQQWQESRTPNTPTFSMLPTIDIQPLLAFFATVQEAENAVNPGISRLKSPRRGDRSGESSPRSFRNNPRAHTRLTRASDSLSDHTEYQKLKKQLQEQQQTKQQLEGENTAFKAKFNFTGRQLAVGLSTTIVATAGITSFVVVKLLR